MCVLCVCACALPVEHIAVSKYCGTTLHSVAYVHAACVVHVWCVPLLLASFYLLRVCVWWCVCACVCVGGWAAAPLPPRPWPPLALPPNPLARALCVEGGGMYYMSFGTSIYGHTILFVWICVCGLSLKAVVFFPFYFCVCS
jgi:hypothetical protein